MADMRCHASVLAFALGLAACGGSDSPPVRCKPTCASASGSGGTPGGSGSGASAGANTTGGTAGTSGGAGGAGGSGASAGRGGSGGSAGSLSAAGTGGTVANAGASGAGAPGGAGGAAAGAAGAPAGGMNAGGSAGGNAEGGDGPVGEPAEAPLQALPKVRQEHSVVALFGEIYVIGGYMPNASNALSVTDSMMAYDPAKDSWRDRKSLPSPLNHGNCGVVNDKLYLAGFYINGGMSTATAQSFVYDPTADTWTEIASMPGAGRAAGCVAVDSGYLYVVGGAHDGKSVDNVARYSPAEDSWEELAPLPEMREHCAAGAIDGTIYVGGGRKDSITGIEEKTWAYDPGADAWTEKAKLVPPRGGLAGAVYHGRFFVFGGEGNKDATSGVFPDIDAYDPKTDTWEKLGEMLIPRHGYGAGVLGDKIYLAGGADKQGGAASANVSVFSFE